LIVSGWLWWPLGVVVWDHGDERQLESCHGVAGHFYLAHGADLSVEWGILVGGGVFSSFLFSLLKSCS
jgi:hypothetical protein